MLLTDQSMTDQLKLTRRIIDRRKKLFAINREDELRLLSTKPLIEENINLVVDEFYRQQLAHSEIEVLIGDSDTLLRLRNSMRNYILDLFSGTYDELYVTSRLRVGKVHKRIGVSPALYMAAVSILISVLSDFIDSTLADGNGQQSNADQIKNSLSRLIMFDVQFVFETYTGSLVAEVEKAKQELEDYTKDLEQIIADRTQELEALSRIDSLTGLLNQRAFYQQLRIELLSSSRRQDRLTLVYMDLNGFKAVNDSLGHMDGDRILANVGNCLKRVVREGNYGCRYGGDEFCIILGSTTNVEAIEVCKRLVQCYLELENNHDVTFSVGIYQTGVDQISDPQPLVREADRRMYLAKGESKQQPGFWLCDTDENLIRLEAS